MNFLKNLLLLLFVVGLIVAMLEGTGRWLINRQEKSLLVSPHLNWTNTHEYNPWCMWSMKPNLTGCMQAYPFGGKRGEWTVNTNRLGLRQGPVEEKGGRTRILAIGDSRTNGMGVNDNETWPAQLQQLLDKTNPNQFEVINAGVVGYTAAQGLAYLKHGGLALKPDMVIACFGYNEGAPIPPPGIGDCVWENPQSTWGITALFKKTFQGMGLDRKPILSARKTRLTPGELLDTLLEMNAVCEASQTKLAYLICPSLPELLGTVVDRPHYAGLLREAGHFAQNYVIDSTAALKSAGTKLYLDDIHLTPAGLQLVAQEVATQIPTLLKPNSGFFTPPATQEECLKLIALNPSFGPGYIVLEQYMSRQTNPDDCVGLFRTLTTQYPDVAQPYYRLGRALEDRMDTNGASAAYRMAIERAAFDMEMLLDVGPRLIKLKDGEGAACAVAAMLNLNPFSGLWDQLTSLMEQATTCGGQWEMVEKRLHADNGLSPEFLGKLRTRFAAHK